MRHLFIINRFSGKPESYKKVESQLEKYKERPDFDIHYTEFAGDAETFSREYVKSRGEYVRVYACGGDGTVNEVVNGIAGLKNCAAAVVPIGSGNDFIRSLNAEKEDFLDIDKLINGEEISVDLLKCGDRISCNSITVGFDCAVAKAVDKFKKKRFVSASLAYKLAIFYCLFKKRSHTFSVTADGKEFERDGTNLLSICAKGKYYGGGIKCSPLADNSDGFIDFTLIKTVGVMKFVALLSTFTKGNHVNNPKLDFVFHDKVKTVSYTDSKPFEIGIDGEIFTVDRADVELIKDGLRVIVP